MELLKACHSMSKPNSLQEKSVKKHARGLLRIIVRLKIPSLVNAIGQHKGQDSSNGLLSSKQRQKNAEVLLRRFTDV